MSIAILLILPGCKDNRRASLERLYSEARLQFQQGYTYQSQESATKGERDSHDLPDLNWRFRDLQAEIFTRNNKPEEAERILAPLPPNSATFDVFWRRKLVLAWAACQLHHYPEADHYLSEAEQLSANKVGLHAELVYFRGRCEIAKNNLQTAETYFQQVLNSPEVDEYVRAWSFANMGLCAKRSLKFEDALEWYIKARSAFAAMKALPLEQGMFGNLGFVYFELRDLPRAKQNTETAAKMAADLKILSDQQLWLLDLGRVQSALGQTGAAEESYKKALSIPSPPGSSQVAVNCLLNLTDLRLAEGKMGLAEESHQEALKLDLKGESLLFWQLDDAAIAAAHGDYAKATPQLLRLLQLVQNEDAQKHESRYKLIWVIQSQLARDYAAQGNSAEAENWFLRSIATIDAAATSMKHQEFRTSLRDNIPVYDGYVAFLIAQKRFPEALHIAQQGRAQTLLSDEKKPPTEAPRPDDAKAWQSKIQHYLARDKSVLLSYFETADECYLWTVTASQLRLSPLGIKQPDLDNLIDSYQQEIQQHLPLSSSRAAKKLFQILVQPGKDLIPKGSHVIVVADSKSYSINFETLVSSQGADHYWIEDVELENAPSIDLLIAPYTKQATSKDVLLIGAPAQADPHFPELPHAKEEMASVRKHFPSGKITSFSGHDATPDSYLKNSPGIYKFIHMATHGTPNAIDPLQSAIILSSGKDGNFKLLAQDIIGSKVRLNAELVTISACEGVGTQLESLEGLLGLEWAFMRAGAHQVIAAVWDQDDAITPALMDDFYDQLTQGKSAIDALHHAKLSILYAGGFHASPYYWASLQLYTRS